MNVHVESSVFIKVWKFRKIVLIKSQIGNWNHKKEDETKVSVFFFSMCTLPEGNIPLSNLC